ncbi:hypothetical protein K492DRAFT_204422 [Lichtheimia hyalospora FSU 10163]|nr:hypothetical protein K492DRAFT_204422 [Lichtheimia hyalospora FSU 10163]
MSKDRYDHIDLHGDKQSSSPYCRSDIKDSQPSKSSRVKLFAVPAFSFAVSIALIGIAIYVYQTANGQSSDYTMANMRVPTVISLLMTFANVFLVGGVTRAISEYKWVTLQKDGGRLSMIDVYDACTRGIGDIAKVITAVRFDMVIIPAIFLQLGLMAVGPASQEILTHTNIETCDNGTGIYYSNLTGTDLTNLGTSGDVGSLTGLKQDYLVRTAFAQSALGFMTQPFYECKAGALNCTFDDVNFFSTGFKCKNGSLNTEIVDINNNNVTTLSEYYGFNNNNSIFGPIVDVPHTFYAGSMQGRTFYDLYNHTDESANSTYDPTIRRLFGDQTMVFVLNEKGDFGGYLENNAMPQVRECTLHSNYNVSSLVHRTDRIKFYKEETRPLNIDYDQLSNNTYWSTMFQPNFLALNAYAMQLTAMRFLCDEKSFERIMDDWSIYVSNPNDTNPVETFLDQMLRNADLSLTFALPTNPIFSTQGQRCYISDNVYMINPAAYYAVTLSLLVPLLWWMTVWIISLYHTKGVSRGNSQIALLVTGLTQSIQQQFQGMSHAGHSDLFDKARQVQVVFGETATADAQGRMGHVAFGTAGEIGPIRHARRMSM